MGEVGGTAQGWMDQLEKLVLTYAVPLGGKILGAILLWIIGSSVIRALRGLSTRALQTRKLDPTLVRYMDSVLGVLLNIVLVVAILSVFGVETTSVAGLLAAAGVAIGTIAGVDAKEACDKLRAALATIPNVLTDPAPVVRIMELTAAGPLLVVRPFCHNKDHWEVHFATFQAIYDTFRRAGYPAAPEVHVALRDQAGRKAA